MLCEMKIRIDLQETDKHIDFVPPQSGGREKCYENILY